MAFTYPLPLAEFQNRLKISVAEFFVTNPRQIDRTAGGAILQASLGEALWRGSFSIPPTNDRSRAAQIDALLSILDRAGSSFLVYDPSKPFPAFDPDGSMLAASPNPTVISGLDPADARRIALSGLPSVNFGFAQNFRITAGDLIGFTYGSSPTRYAVHRAVVDETVNNQGESAFFEVTPPLQPGAVLFQGATLIRPPIKAILEPNPRFSSHRPVVSDGQQFSFVQTLR